MFYFIITSIFVNRLTNFCFYNNFYIIILKLCVNLLLNIELNIFFLSVFVFLLQFLFIPLR